FPTSRCNWIDSNILVSLTSKWRGADLVSLFINVSNLALLLIRCVRYVNVNVLLTILNRYHWNTGLTIRLVSGVTSMRWNIYCSPVGTLSCTCAVGYLTTDRFTRGFTVDLRYLLRRGRLTIWRRHVDCPRDRLVQIRLVGTINLLTRWRLGSWCYRRVVVDTSLPMFNLDSNVIRVSTS